MTDRPLPPVPITADPGRVLAEGEIEVLGRLPWSSNATLLAHLRCTGSGGSVDEALAVYKPAAGERPLHDFPPGLHRREWLAFELATHLGLDLIPPTVVRDGPHGEGSLQLFVDADHEQHYLTLVEDPRHHPWLRRLAVFDLVTNQTDRKSGHVLAGTDGRLWAIDNGLAFHHEFKVRTVIWDFAGEPVPDDMAEPLARVADGDLPAGCRTHLTPFERDALVTRARALRANGVLPEPPWDRYSYPWPLV